jgi:predicted aspartyl protease
MFALLAVLTVLVSPANSQEPVAVDPPPLATSPLAIVATRNDTAMRMTVPVTIDGQGPFQFVLDTGADRTVVSTEIAKALRLVASGTVTMHSMSGISDIGTVRVNRLGLAGLTTQNIDAPALLQTNLGAQGLLGLDALKKRRIILDFEKKRLSVLAPGEREPFDPDTIVVTARSRFGQLVLVDADVDGTPITVIVDTGAQTTIGNTALRNLLAKRRRKLEFFPTNLIDVTGAEVPAEYAAVGRIRIAGLTIEDTVIAFAEVHPFKRYALSNRPAMLLGTDSLRGFRRVSVDFAQRRVRFLPPGKSL